VVIALPVVARAVRAMFISDSRNAPTPEVRGTILMPMTARIMIALIPGVHRTNTMVFAHIDAAE